MKKWWGGVEGRGVEARAGVGDRAAGWELGGGREVMRVVRLGGLNRVAQELGRVDGAREGVVTQQLRTRTRGDGGGGAGGDGCGDSGCAQGAAAAFAAGRAECAHAHAAPLHAAGARGTCGPRRARRVRTTAGFSFEGGRPRRTLPCGGLRLPSSRGTQPAATASTSARPVPLASPCREGGGSVRRCFSRNQSQSQRPPSARNPCLSPQPKPPPLLRLTCTTKQKSARETPEA